MLSASHLRLLLGLHQGDTLHLAALGFEAEANKRHRLDVALEFLLHRVVIMMAEYEQTVGIDLASHTHCSTPCHPSHLSNYRFDPSLVLCYMILREPFLAYPCSAVCMTS